jgi:hypothetical protein
MSEFTCSTCKKPEKDASTDTYVGCAPIMSDGRLFTNWAPRCAQVYTDMHTKKPLSSYEGRQAMITGAEESMKKNAVDAYMQARCGPCYENPDWNSGTMLPELNIQTCDARTCTFTPNNKSGLGLGREYWNPKMESEYQQRFIAEKEKEQSFFKAQLAHAQAHNSSHMPF